MKMKLAIIIPAFNEEQTIANVIKAIPQEIVGINEIEIIVIDDGSSDRTKFEAESAGAIVISHPKNNGVGAAFNTGIRAAIKKNGDIIVNIDADGRFDSRDIPILISPILRGKADFVTASRFKDPSLTPNMPKIKIWGNKRMSKLISFLSEQKFFDVSCGFRAYSRDIALKLTLFGKFTYTQETFLDLVFKGANIKEIPLAVKNKREYGKSKVASNLWRYAFKTSKIIFRAYRDYKPLKFFGLVFLPFSVIGLLLELFFILHYCLTGSFTPHKWAGFSGLGSVVLDLIFLIIGLVADLLCRIRMNQEELLYFARKREYKLQSKKQK